MGPTTITSTSKLNYPISGFNINEAQREIEQTPSNPILPTQPSGHYEVDESGKAREVEESAKCPETFLIAARFPRSWNKNRTCAELWNATLGGNRKSHCRTALSRGEELLPQG